MKIYIKFLLIVILAGCTSKKNFLSMVKNNPAYKCGGFTSVVHKNGKLKDSVIIYGFIKSCTENQAAPISIVSIKNSAQKSIKIVQSDFTGYYRVKLISGTYSVYAANVSMGKIDTGLLDYFPGDSVKLDLFLSSGEGLKN